MAIEDFGDGAGGISPGGYRQQDDFGGISILVLCKEIMLALYDDIVED